MKEARQNNKGIFKLKVLSCTVLLSILIIPLDYFFNVNTGARNLNFHKKK